MLKNRTLYFGDNLEILREKIPDGVFDLIYLDPPFNSNRNYNVLFKEGVQDSPAQVQAFEDSWHWTREAQEVFEELVGVRPSKTKINEQISNLMQALEKLVGHNDMLAYLTMMTIRLIELRRVLKSAGSIYLHCDPTASHYLKVVMDVVFEKQNFLSEIVWCYDTGGRSTSSFPQKHDIILRYSKTSDANFYYDQVSLPRDTSTMHEGIFTDDEGRQYQRNIKAGKEYRYYLDKGVLPNDWWSDIQALNPAAKERLGYPTQKPEALLERIIKASSKEGDWVLDPFCGCGTTVAVAERLKRNWVGIDITMLAINLMNHRLRDQFGLGRNEMNIDGIPKDLSGARALFQKDPFAFEYWALDLVNAVPAQSKTKENMRGADKGIDGVINFIKDIENGKQVYGKLLVQVKGGGTHRNDIATLKGDIERERADGGLFITLEKPTQPMREEAVSSGSYDVKFSKAKFPKIQIITVEELLNGKKPEVPLIALPYYKEAKAVKVESKNTGLGI